MALIRFMCTNTCLGERCSCTVILFIKSYSEMFDSCGIVHFSAQSATALVRLGAWHSKMISPSLPMFEYKKYLNFKKSRYSSYAIWELDLIFCWNYTYEPILYTQFFTSLEKCIITRHLWLVFLVLNKYWLIRNLLEIYVSISYCAIIKHNIEGLPDASWV